MFMQQESIDLPSRQARFRQACVNGDVRAADKVLSSQVCGWKGWLLHLVGLNNSQVPADVEFVYITDNGRTPLHYIASGIPHDHPHLQDLYSSEDVTLRSWNGKRRAHMLRWLHEHGHIPKSFDWNATDLNGRTAVFWAVLTHSVEVLEELCALANQCSEVSLDMSLNDRSNVSPLDVAVASQQWRAVHILVSHGGLKDSVRLRNAVDSLASLAPDVMGGRRPGAGATSWAQGISSMLNGLLCLWATPCAFKTGAAAASGTASGPPRSDSMLSIGEPVDEDEEDEHVPATACPAPLVFASMQEVEAYWDEQAHYVASVCSINTGHARLLLKEHGHDVDAAIQGFLVQKASDQGRELSPDALMCTCCVCFQQFNNGEDVMEMACGHNEVCSSCWRQYILARLEDGHVSHIQCVVPECKMPISLVEARKVLSETEYNQLQRQVLRWYVDSNPNLKWCPRPNCGCSISLAEQLNGRDLATLAPANQQNSPLTVRCKCNYEFCWHCLEEAHEPASCEQVQQWRKLLNEEHAGQEAESQTWIADHTQPCPTCGAKVQRDSGCNHMICSICGQHYCYVCGRDWSLHGPQTGGFYACTMVRPGTIEASSLRTLTHKVSSAIRNAVRALYTRQRDYIRRYLTHSDDVLELSRLLQHAAGLVSNAMLLDAAHHAAAHHHHATGDSTHGHGHRTRRSSGGTDAPTECPDCSPRGCSAALRVHAASATASTNGVASCHDNRVAAGPAAAALQSRTASEALVDRSSQRLDAEYECGSPCSSSSMGRPSLDTNLSLAAMSMDSDGGGDGAAEDQRASAGGSASKSIGKPLTRRPTWSSLIKEWEATVSNGRNVLRNTYIATFFMERCSERHYLESLQARLEAQIGQLTEIMHSLPHRQAVLDEGGPAPEHAPRQDPIARILLTLGRVVQGAGHAMLCLGFRLLNAHQPGEISVRGQQIRDQFYYVVALNQRRGRILRLMQRAKQTCHAIVRTGRVKLQASSAASTSGKVSKLSSFAVK